MLFIFERDNFTCHYCNKKLKKYEDLTIDHKIPVVKKGTHSLDNIVTCCKICNYKKHTKDYDYFISKLQKLKDDVTKK